MDKTTFGTKLSEHIPFSPPQFDVRSQTQVQAITEKLVRGFQSHEIKSRIQGKKKNESGQWVDNYVDYIEGNAAIDRLNEAVTPLGWDFKIMHTEVVYDIDKSSRPVEVCVYGSLEIHTPWGPVTKQHIGSAMVKYTDEKEYSEKTSRSEKTGRRVPVSVSEDKKAAATDALKKCATLFGIYNHGYRKAATTVANDEVLKNVLTQLRELFKAKGMTSQQFLDFASGVTRKTILGWGDLSLSQAQLCYMLLEAHRTIDPIRG